MNTTTSFAQRLANYRAAKAAQAASVRQVLTADQIALNEYIAQENAAFEARAKAEGATWWCTYALTAADLAEYGVFNISQFKAHREENERLCAAKEERKNWYAGE